MTTTTSVGLTLVDLLARNADARPDAAAVIVEAGTWTHAMLFEAVRRRAVALAASGVRRGDRVVLLAGNRVEVLVLLGAAAWLGAILVPLNVRLSPAELAQQSRDATPVLVLIDAPCSPLWDAAWPDGMAGVATVMLEADAGDRVAAADASSADAVERQDAADLGAVMLYTAAVDGHARGAVLAQSQLIASAQQIGHAWSLKADDRWLGVLPLFHAAGIGLALAVLGAGGACVLLSRFDATVAVAAVDQHHVTLCATFAPMLSTLLDAAEAVRASLRSLRICTGLEPLDAVQRLATICPSADFWSAYGQAEVSAMVCLGLQRDRPGAAGRAVAPTQVRVQDAHGRPLAIGMEGEIAVCGPTVFLGYWDATRQRPLKPDDPWHRTGDLGRMDSDGWLWFLGRAAHKQLIKTGGENVYPTEVEQALLGHPAVAEGFVFGTPDPRWGEAVHAVCVLRAGMSADEKELVRFVEERLARYKRPRRVRFMPGPLDDEKRMAAVAVAQDSIGTNDC